MNRFVFGPVPSRRLGFSLGVDVIPTKCCTLDCIYCQVGRTTQRTAKRSSFFSPKDIVDEIEREVSCNKLIDFVTFSGSGEPTLNEDLGAIIGAVKERVSTPIAVITNGTLLHRPDVRKDLLEADLLMPSLDAATEDIFCRINRPEPSIRVEEMLKGLKTLRAEYQGEIWLEIMLIQGINDAAQHLEILKEVVGAIEADRVQLNSVTRPPCDTSAKGIAWPRLTEIQRFFGPDTEVICEFEKDGGKAAEGNWEERVVAILKRRALTCDDVVAITGEDRVQADRSLKRLLADKRITKKVVNEVPYYLAAKTE